MSTPRPMPTPNLAGLLSRPVRQQERAPKRPPEEPLFESTPMVDVGAVVGPTTGKGAADEDEEAGPSVTHDAQQGRQYLRSITIYLPRSVHRSAGREAAARNTTRTALILAAINATHQQIGHVLSSSTRETVSKSDLFDIPQDRAVTEPSAQTTIRVTDSQFEAIENLVAEHETNRSKLVTAALRLHLTEPEATESDSAPAS